MTRILICEDDLAVGTVIGKMLTIKGYEVEMTISAEDALLRTLGSNPPDLLITDLSLPGAMGGGDLVLALGISKPALPILIVTGNQDGIIRSQVCQSQATIIDKPFRMADLIAQVEQAVNVSLSL